MIGGSMSIYGSYLDWLRRTFGGDEFLQAISARRLPDRRARRIMEILLEKKPRTILEIGRFKGFSLGLFKYFSPDSLVVSVDPVLHMEACQIAQQFKRVVLVTGTVVDIDPWLGVGLDFVLIDGDHQYLSAKLDWRMIDWRLHQGAGVFFDNLTHPAGCGKVYEEVKEGKTPIGTIYRKERVDGDSGIIWVDKV